MDKQGVEYKRKYRAWLRKVKKAFPDIDVKD